MIKGKLLSGVDFDPKLFLYGLRVGRHDIAEILLKVALSTKIKFNQSIRHVALLGHIIQILSQAVFVTSP
jgi:hypothetical protein